MDAIAVFPDAPMYNAPARGVSSFDPDHIPHCTMARGTNGVDVGRDPAMRASNMG